MGRDPFTTMFGPKPCRKCGRDHYPGACPESQAAPATTILEPQRGVEVVYRRLGEWVKDRRRATGLRQQEVADRMGLTRASIANIETGRQRVLMHDALALLVILGGLEAVQRFYDCLVVAPTNPQEPADD